MKYRLSVLIVLTALLATFSVSGVLAQETNLVDTCVTDFDAEADYFPEKAEVTHSSGWSVEYFNNYKVVTVNRPWATATEDDVFQYVLVQCGTPVPEDIDAPVIEVPTGRVIALSTTYLPHLVNLRLVDELIGVDTTLYINSPDILEKVEAGELIEVGSGSSINVELVLDSEPGVVFAYGSGFPEYDTHPVLLDAGVNVVLNGDLAETSPLGRAEWIKFTALFFNAEAAATTVFDGEVAAYDELVKVTQEIPAEDRPLVLWDAFTSFNEAWFVPGELSYAGQFLRDAGANYVLSDAAEVQDVAGSVPFDFETVYDAGLDADVWLPNLFGTATLDDLLASDERYGDLRPFAEGNVYNNDARVNANGGNDIYELGVTSPHLILADLIKILYPDLLPDYELTFYRQME